MDDGEPTWSNIYQFVFRSCRVDNCHGGGTAGLNFSSKEAGWLSLVEQPARPMGRCEAFGKLRVTPFDPDNSLLLLKLNNDRAPCGEPMPPGGQLSQMARDRVREWITRGAAND